MYSLMIMYLLRILFFMWYFWLLTNVKRTRAVGFIISVEKSLVSTEMAFRLSVLMIILGDVILIHQPVCGSKLSSTKEN